MHTDAAGLVFVNEFFEVNKELLTALYAEDVSTCAKLISKLIPIGKAWLQHIADKANLNAGWQLIHIFQSLKDKGDNLTLHDLDIGFEECAAVCEQYLKLLTLCCKC